jgi:hypothetical protein
LHITQNKRKHSSINSNISTPILNKSKQNKKEASGTTELNTPKQKSKKSGAVDLTQDSNNKNSKINYKCKFIKISDRYNAITSYFGKTFHLSKDVGYPFISNHFLIS